MKKLKTFIFLICLFFPFVFSGCENVGKKSISIPKNLSVETNGIISFDMVKGAKYYTLDINNSTLNIFPTADEKNQVTRVDNTLYYDASRIFVLGNSYEVKVKAVGKEKSSAFSESESYVHKVTIHKANNLKFNSTVLTWDAVEHASVYVVKVVAPYNNVEDQSPSGIEKADLTEYTFSTNRFPFGSLISVAGEYKFFVNAISSEQNLLQSGYTASIVYTNNVQLKTPVNAGVYIKADFNKETERYEDNFHLLTVVDENANAVNLKIGDKVETAYLDDNDSNVEVPEVYEGIQNIYDINLTTLFNNKINFDLLNNFNVTAQAVYVTNQDKNFYISSAFSTECYAESIGVAPTPTAKLTLNEATGDYELSWSVEDFANISGFAVYVKTDLGIETIEFDKNTSSLLLPHNATSAWVQTLGKGKYLSSNLSQCCSTLNTMLNSRLNFSVNSTQVSWRKDNGMLFENATFIVEMDNQVVQTRNNFVSIENRTEMFKYFAVTVVVDGYAPLKVEKNVEEIRKMLTRPYNLTSNQYIISFRGDHANTLGYYVYVNGNKINKLFTASSNIVSIDLSKYLTGGEYSVQVQAVADSYSIYIDSSYSTEINIQLIKELEKPTFVYNANNSPITAVKDGNVNKYYLTFSGVQNAGSYEILIDHKLVSNSLTGSGIHRIDVSSVITGPGVYPISIRALPNTNATNLKASETATETITISQQLPKVENISYTVSEDGKYTLVFETLAIAGVEYSVRIVKDGDSSYIQYLSNLSVVLRKDLSNPFTTKGACDITDYLQQQGKYYIYVTALAPVNSGTYANSDEAKMEAEIFKGSTLAVPSIEKCFDISEKEYVVSFNGDNNAEYFIVTVSDPDRIIHEYKVLNNSVNKAEIEGKIYSVCNINSCINKQGSYRIKIKAYAGNNLGYEDSLTSEEYVSTYILNADYDFVRIKNSINGEEFDCYINNITELKNALWYNYLFEIDFTYQLRLRFEFETAQNAKTGEQTIETMRSLLIRYAEEAKTLGLYNFENDEEWNTALEQSNNTVMLKIMCEKLINLYPEMHQLKALSVSLYSQSNDRYQIYYENAFNQAKVENNTLVHFVDDYSNNFKYLSSTERRSVNNTFIIDTLSETMLVSTTEQLLQAVQYGKKPVFVGNCEIAENVYANAKQVLVAIVSNNMTELEKTTAIFDWLTYAIRNNYKATYYLNESQVAVPADESMIEKYGTRQEFYLEGVFFNINKENRGGSDGEFFLGNRAGTSESFAKAFTLLCGIEGIETRKVNGYYTINDTQKTSHAWNKVYLKTGEERQWYVVDGLFSQVTSVVTSEYDNNFIVPYSQETSSHMFFLTTEQFDKDSVTKRSTFLDVGNTNAQNRIDIYIDEFDATYNKNEYICNTNYDYYAYTNIQFKKKDLSFVVYAKDATYTKHYDTKQIYNAYTRDASNDSNSMQNYLLNLFVDAYRMMKQNELGRCSIELKFNTADNNSSSILSSSDIYTALSKLNSSVLMGDEIAVQTNDVKTAMRVTQDSSIYILTLSIDKSE